MLVQSVEEYKRTQDTLAILQMTESQKVSALIQRFNG